MCYNSSTIRGSGSNKGRVVIADKESQHRLMPNGCLFCCLNKSFNGSELVLLCLTKIFATHSKRVWTLKEQRKISLKSHLAFHLASTKISSNQFHALFHDTFWHEIRINHENQACFKNSSFLKNSGIFCWFQCHQIRKPTKSPIICGIYWIFSQNRQTGDFYLATLFSTCKQMLFNFDPCARSKAAQLLVYNLGQLVSIPSLSFSF